MACHGVADGQRHGGLRQAASKPPGSRTQSGVAESIAETNRIHSVLVGVQNRTLRPLFGTRPGRPHLAEARPGVNYAHCVRVDAQALPEALGEQRAQRRRLADGPPLSHAVVLAARQLHGQRQAQAQWVRPAAPTTRRSTH
jgi:hypothetical protein